MSLIIFDTETTGLIDNMAIPLKSQPQIVELFALKINEEAAAQGELVEEGEWHSLFTAKKIEADALKAHGLTLERLAGEPTFAQRFDSLCDFFLGTRTLVGHNLSFDRDMLLIEIRRMGKAEQFPWPPKHLCTVEATEGEEGFRLGLSVLHERLFGEAFDNAHRATADVRATARCLVKLMGDGVIKL